MKQTLPLNVDGIRVFQDPSLESFIRWNLTCSLVTFSDSKSELRPVSKLYFVRLISHVFRAAYIQ